MVVFLFSIKVALLLLVFCLFSDVHSSIFCKFDQIYQFGDSISDTGNLVREFPIGTSSPYNRLPYGETFFKRPTGRCSNGLLMIDYISMTIGLHLLQPYKKLRANSTHGVNFAVAGSTALSYRALARRGIISHMTISSLDVQLNWMTTYFHHTCPDCAEKLNNALFMVGEIGGNDYNYAIFQGKSLEEVRSMVPVVVKAILNAAKEVIKIGAKRVVIPGNFPIGCFPIYQTAFQNNTSSTAYDENQCLKQFNELSVYHNDELQRGIHELNHENPDTTIVYGDYYRAYLLALRVAWLWGFETQKACCGHGGKYNFNMRKMCGTSSDVSVCAKPDRYIHWDGIHLTQKGYGMMVPWLLHTILSSFHCL